MNIKSLKTQFIAAIAMVLVAAVAMGSSTYAWFAMNNKVTVTGMKVTTKVGDNLFIAQDTLTSTATIKTDSSYKTFLADEINGKLEPVSTVNGRNYFYTAGTNVTGTGAASRAAYIAYANDTEGNTAFNTNYSTTGAVGYVDYVFQLKAVNTDTENAAKLGLTELKLTYGGAAAATAGNETKAYRVALFVENLDTQINGGALTAQAPLGGTEDGLTGVDKTVLYIPSGATNFTAGNAVASASALGAVAYNSTAASSVWDVAANTTAYFKVVVRLWLEGEDNTCNTTTYADLTDTWGLDLGFQLGNSTAVTGVTNITTAAQGATKADLTTATAASEATTFDEMNLYKISTVTLDGADLYSSTATIGASSRIFKVGTDNKPIDVTYRCALPTT